MMESTINLFVQETMYIYIKWQELISSIYKTDYESEDKEKLFKGQKDICKISVIK